MLEILNLVSYGAYGGAVGELFQQWEQMGFFSYILPFLLIFAIVFGVLSKIKALGENKAVNAIIALVVGLIAVNIDFVPLFFSTIFPQLGVGLAIMLVAVILLEFFFVREDANKNSWVNYVYFGIGAIIFLVILSKSSDYFGGFGSSWWSEYWPLIIGVVFIITVISIIARSGSRE